MEDTLFTIDEEKVAIVPQSLLRAAELATCIVQSDYHIHQICTMFVNPITKAPHIDAEKLRSMIEHGGIISIDRIRDLTFMNASACSIPKYDPRTIYLNPLMLLEMIDREQEEFELQGNQVSELSLFPNTKPKSGQFNSLSYSAQVAETEMEASTEAKKEASESESRAAGCGTKRERPPTTHKEVHLVPSTLTVSEKNTLMLTILLVRETDNILNREFSSLLQGGNTNNTNKANNANTAQIRFMRSEDETPFSDFGCMMLRKLFDFVIHHVCDPHFPTPFAIHEILGTRLQTVPTKYVILEPSPEFRTLLTCADYMQYEVTSELLNMVPTGSADYYGVHQRDGVVLGRMGDMGVSDAYSVEEGGKRHKKQRGGYSHSGSENEGEEDRGEVEVEVEVEPRFSGKA